MIRKMFLVVYHAGVLSAAIFGNLEPRQKDTLLKRLHLAKAYHAPVVKRARAEFDQRLRTLAVTIAREIRNR